MKKYIKGLVGIVLVSSLCGCGRIDSRQNYHAVSEISLEAVLGCHICGAVKSLLIPVFRRLIFVIPVM